MPGLYRQLGTQAIGQRLQTCGKHLPDVLWLKLTVGLAFLMPIDAGAECMGRNKAIDRMAWSDRDSDSRIERFDVRGLAQGAEWLA